jgi:hypothetical protein
MRKEVKYITRANITALVILNILLFSVGLELLFRVPEVTGS